MTTVYIIAGITCLHLALAAINTVGIKGAFFVKTSTKPLCLAFNWLIPLVGPIATYFIVRDSFSDGVRAEDLRGVHTVGAVRFRLKENLKSLA